MKMHLAVLCMVLCVTMIGPAVTNTSFAVTTDKRKFQTEVAVTNMSFAVTTDRSTIQTEVAITKTSFAVTTDRSKFQTEVAVTNTSVAVTTNSSTFHSFLSNANQTILLNHSMSSYIPPQLIISKENITGNVPYSSALNFEGKLTESAVVKIVQLQEYYCYQKPCVLYTGSDNESAEHLGHTKIC